MAPLTVEVKLTVSTWRFRLAIAWMRFATRVGNLLIRFAERGIRAEQVK